MILNLLILSLRSPDFIPLAFSTGYNYLVILSGNGDSSSKLCFLSLMKNIFTLSQWLVLHKCVFTPIKDYALNIACLKLIHFHAWKVELR